MTIASEGDVKASMIVTLKTRGIGQDEIDDWYDLEHIPQRIALPGFMATERWTVEGDTPLSLTVYDVTTLDVLQSAPYLAITGANMSPWTRRVFPRTERNRYEAELTLDRRKLGREKAEGLLMVGMNVAPAMEAEFNRWYVEEHVPNLFALPGVLGARRYEARTGGQKHIAMYHMTSPDVQASPEWKKAIDTPWGSKVRPHTSDRMRFVCSRYRRAA